MRKKVVKPAASLPAPIYERIREILESARTSLARTVNTTQVVANWLIGREIVEEQQQGRERAEYGARLVEGLAARLSKEFGRGFSRNNLEHFRDFYLTYPQLCALAIPHAVRGELRAESAHEISHTGRGKSTSRHGNSGKSHTPCDESASHPSAEWTNLVQAPVDDAWQPGQLHSNLSWTHYRTLLRVDAADARGFYEVEAIQNNWSARELERQINSLLFERLAKSRDKAGLRRLATKGQEILQPADIFKDPVVIEFLGLPESSKLVESDLETALLDNLQAFLLELGKGFAFMDRQQRITLDGDHFYVDLVFYHVILKCHVLIDLKVGKLTHGDLGQLQLYVNFFDQERCSKGDNPTLGLILCTDKNDAVVKYTLGAEQSGKIFASRYKLYLPTEQELCDELRREVHSLPSTAGTKRLEKKPRGRRSREQGG